MDVDICFYEVCQMPSSTSGSVRKLHLNRGNWSILSSIPRWLSIKILCFLLPESRSCIRIPGTKSLPRFLCLNLKLIYCTTFSTSKPRHCIVIQFLSGTRVLCQSSVPKVFWCPLLSLGRGLASGLFHLPSHPAVRIAMYHQSLISREQCLLMEPSGSWPLLYVRTRAWVSLHN